MNRTSQQPPGTRMTTTATDDEEGSIGIPLPDFRATGIQLQTVAPAWGVPVHAPPDYLDYDPKGRGVVVTMFANAGMAYLLGIGAGGSYGLRQGLRSTPSHRFRVQLNSVLNHCGRYGSRVGNTMGVYAVMYSLYEGLADQYDLDERLGIRSLSPTMASIASPAIAASLSAATYYGPSGPRVATLAGSIGFGAVALTYTAYTFLGIPHGSRGFLFF